MKVNEKGYFFAERLCRESPLAMKGRYVRLYRQAPKRPQAVYKVPAGPKNMPTKASWQEGTVE